MYLRKHSQKDYSEQYDWLPKIKKPTTLFETGIFCDIFHKNNYSLAIHAAWFSVYLK